jgi:hypothetical protein
MYVYKPRRDIKDTGDYPCGYRDPEDGNAEQQFCFTPGDLNAVALKCNSDQKCRAFVSGTRAGVAGGYFKTKRGPVTPLADTSVYLWLKGPGAHVRAAQQASYICTHRSSLSAHHDLAWSLARHLLYCCCFTLYAVAAPLQREYDVSLSIEQLKWHHSSSNLPTFT